MQKETRECYEELIANNLTELLETSGTKDDDEIKRRHELVNETERLQHLLTDSEKIEYEKETKLKHEEVETQKNDVSWKKIGAEVVKATLIGLPSILLTFMCYKRGSELESNGYLKTKTFQKAMNDSSKGIKR